MNRLLTFSLCFLVFLSGYVFGQDADFEVRVAVTAPHLTRSLQQDLVSKAKFSALTKYLVRLDSGIGQDLVRKACAEADLFIESIEQKGEVRWVPIAIDHGQLEGSFIVELKLEAINQWLKVNGFKTQGNLEIVILEEPPSLGSMKLIGIAGTEADGAKTFIQNYTSFQRRVRDCLIKKVDEFGFDVSLLADNDLYAEYKSKDESLVGVFYEPESNQFVVNRGLLKAVQGNNPDTLVLYYRLDTVEYEAARKQVRATVALSIKNLDSSITKSFGSETFALTSNATTVGMIVDDIGFAAEKAILKLMNSEGAGSRLNRLAMEIKNAANVPVGPIKVTINGTVFDAKIRKRLLYQLRKQLVANGITLAHQIKTQNNTMTFVAHPGFTDSETLYFEKVYPIFEQLGVELADDKVFYGKGTLVIKP